MIRLNGHRLSKSFKKQSDARDWLKQTRGQIDQGLNYNASQTSLTKFMDAWLTSKKSMLRAGTYEQYSYIARDYILPALGSIKLSNLRPDQIQALYDKLVTDEIGARTIKLVHSVIHGCLEHALKLGLVTRNLAEATTPPGYHHEEMHILTESQVSQLLIAAQGEWHEHLYYLAIVTGARQGELLGLKWTEVDWEGKFIRILQQAKQVTGGGFEMAPVKTAAGRRTVDLGDGSIIRLRAQFERVNDMRIAQRARWKDNDLVFPSQVGTPDNPSGVLKDFKTLLKRSGLPPIRFHDLRHTAASIMLTHGTPPIIVSHRLGHSKPSITLDIYGHLIPDSQQIVATLMDKLIAPVAVEI